MTSNVVDELRTMSEQIMDNLSRNLQSKIKTSCSRCDEEIIETRLTISSSSKLCLRCATKTSSDSREQRRGHRRHSSSSRNSTSRTRNSRRRTYSPRRSQSPESARRYRERRERHAERESRGKDRSRDRERSHGSQNASRSKSNSWRNRRQEFQTNYDVRVQVDGTELRLQRVDDEPRSVPSSSAANGKSTESEIVMLD